VARQLLRRNILQAGAFLFWLYFWSYISSNCLLYGSYFLFNENYLYIFIHLKNINNRLVETIVTLYNERPKEYIGGRMQKKRKPLILLVCFWWFVVCLKTDPESSLSLVCLVNLHRIKRKNMIWINMAFQFNWYYSFFFYPPIFLKRFIV
jgi:hypothetical protein